MVYMNPTALASIKPQVSYSRPPVSFLFNTCDHDSSVVKTEVEFHGVMKMIQMFPL